MKPGTKRPNIYRLSPFVSKFLLTGGTNIALGIFGLATSVLAARLLGAEGRGQLAAIQMWPSFIGTIAMLGMSEALVYFSAREPDQSGRYLGSGMLLALLASLPLMTLGYFVMPLLLSAQSSDAVIGARYYLFIAPIYALVGMPLHTLQGRNDLTTWNVLRLTPNIGWLVVLCGAWLVALHEPKTMSQIYLVVLATLFLPVACVAYCRIPGRFWPDIRMWRRMLNYGIPSMLSGVPQILNIRLDQMLMAAFLPSQMLGLYVVAVGWSGAIHPLMSALGSVLFPRVASQQNQLEQTKLFIHGIRLGGLIAITAGLSLAVLTPFGLPLLFGSEFKTVVSVSLILVLAGAIASFNTTLEEGLRGLGKPTTVMKAEFGGLIITTIFLLLLLPTFGVLGAALTSLFSYSTVAILLLASAQRLTRQSVFSLLFPSSEEVYSMWRRVQSLKRGIPEHSGYK